MEKIDNIIMAIWALGLVFIPIIIWILYMMEEKPDPLFVRWDVYNIIFYLIWFALGILTYLLHGILGISGALIFLLLLIIVILCIPEIKKFINFLINITDRKRR